MGAGTPKQTAYVRDASGNVMAIYEKGNTEINSGHLSQIEVPLYGSSRLGIWRAGREVETTGWELFDTDPMTGTDGGIAGGWERGRVQFELSNHLGNVLVTISDARTAVDDGTYEVLTACPTCLPGFPCLPCYDVYVKQNSTPDDVVDYYLPQVLTANDYYPGGMQMPGRTFNSSSYRYGFQNQEIDKELWDGAVSFEYRVEDPRLVRFFSVDPLTADYPHNSPYAFAENRLIDGIELEGLEWMPTKDKNGNVTDYSWAGYKSDGTPKDGTVSSAILPDRDYTYWFTSNQKNQTGTLDIMTTKHAPTSYPQGYDNSTLYNYTFNFKQSAASPGYAYQYTSVTGTLWSIEHSSGLLTGDKKEVSEPIKDKTVIERFPTWSNKLLNTENVFSIFKRALGFGAPPTSITPVYPETILIPLPKGLNILKYETGGVKQWFRFGKSFSKVGDTPTIGFRWGAGGGFLKTINNPLLQVGNEWIRGRRLIPGLRTWWNEGGHFHIMKLPNKPFYQKIARENIKNLL